MIVDTSALVAILLEEPHADELVKKLANSPASGIGTPTLVELGMILSSRFEADARGLTRRLLDEFDIVEVPFGGDHWREAVSAFQKYGRGRHKAGLNFGDCLTYAVARLADEPLLFVGNDFTETDLVAA